MFLRDILNDDYSKKGKLINGIEVLGGRECIRKVCEERKVEEIILSIPSDKYFSALYTGKSTVTRGWFVILFHFPKYFEKVKVRFGQLKIESHNI